MILCLRQERSLRMRCRCEDIYDVLERDNTLLSHDRFAQDFFEKFISDVLDSLAVVYILSFLITETKKTEKST